MGITSWLKTGALVILGAGLCGCQNDGAKNNSVFGPPVGKQTTQNPPAIPPSAFPTSGGGVNTAGNNAFNPATPLGGGNRNLGPSNGTPTSFNSAPNNGFYNPSMPSAPANNAFNNAAFPGSNGLNTPTLPGSNSNAIVPGASGVRNNEYYQVPGGNTPGNLQPPANNFAPGGLAPFGGSAPPLAPTPGSGGFQVPRN